MNSIIREDLKAIVKDESIDWRRFDGKRVLITGAYGMLASYMAGTLIYLNEELGIHTDILAVGRKEEKMRERFGDWCDRSYFHFLGQDISEELLVDGPVDFIIHAASHASTDYYSKDPVGVMRPNLLGTMRTLELAREKRSEGYLFFSSGEIYGAIQKPLVSETDGGYLDPATVRSCYGESKRAGETLCVSYAHQYHVPTRIVRPSHTYGPTMSLGDSRVFAAFIADAAAGRDLAMTSDGTATRNFIYLTDAVRAYFKVLLDGEDGNAYNVTNPAGKTSIYDLALLIASLRPELGLKVTRKEPDPAYLDRGKNAYSLLDTAKLKALGWKPEISLKEGFSRTLESFLV